MSKNIENHVRICKKHNEEKKRESKSLKFVCKKCAVERTALWRKNNAERYQAQNKNGYQERKKILEVKRKENPGFYLERESDQVCNKHNLVKVYAADNAIVCRQCKIEYSKEYRKRNPGKRYNLTKKQYDELFKDKEKGCDICKKINHGAKRLCIDHCHELEKMGIIKIRGLLCVNCNAGIGNFKDNIDILQAAITYLQQHEHIKDDATGVIHE